MATIIQKNTKEMMEKKLNSLYAVQQQMNDNVGGGPTRATGGNVIGGYTQKQSNWKNGIQGFGMDSYNIDFGLGQLPNIPSFKPMYTGDLPTGFNTGSGVNTTFNPNANKFVPSKIDTSFLKPPSVGKLTTSLENTKLAGAPKVATNASTTGNVNWGQVGAFAGQMAPMIYNLAKGLQKPDKVKPNYNPYEGQIRSLMANRRYNIDPQLTLNRTAQAVTNRNINQVGNSRGERMANYGASQNYRMAGDAAAWSQKNNMDNQYMAEQAQMDANLGGARANMDWNVQTADAQNKAATNQFLGQGFNDMGKFAQTQQLMQNQQKNSTDLARIFQDQFGGIAGFMPQIQEMLKNNNVTPKTA